MSKTKKRVLGCLVSLIILCVVSIPVAYITLKQLDSDIDQIKRDVEDTLEYGEIASQQVMQTNQKAHQEGVEVFWLTQTAKAHQTSTSVP